MAQAENEIALIRHAKRALIDHTDIFGDFKTPPRDPTDPLEDLWMMIVQGPQFEAKDVLLTMQQEEVERSMAIKRVLLKLENLSLYEKRAAARRDRSIRKLIKLKPMLESPSKSKSISKV